MEELSKPSFVIYSEGSVILNSFTLPDLIQLIFPSFQYFSFLLKGVPPNSTLNSLPIVETLNDLGISFLSFSLQP